MHLKELSKAVGLAGLLTLGCAGRQYPPDSRCENFILSSQEIGQTSPEVDQAFSARLGEQVRVFRSLCSLQLAVQTVNTDQHPDLAPYGYTCLLHNQVQSGIPMDSLARQVAHPRFVISSDNINTPCREWFFRRGFTIGTTMGTTEGR